MLDQHNSEQKHVKYGKARAFYPTFERKGSGDLVTHYCPGCGHGVAQKLIASVIDDLGIQDRTIFLSPVGCAVFSYYYFDTGNIQCSHGRAPAVATGVRRTLDDAIIISYQGDGDLAGIGMTEIVHAANRGENITVIFINNAIYGMTGGQMAPTTPVGRKTLTTPFGRELIRDGRPIGMAELMESLSTPVYIERCSLATVKDVMKTRKAIKKGLQNQIDHLGFSFIEILSPCPTNWRMTPVQACEWTKNELAAVFPLKVFRESHGKKAPTSLITPFPFLDDASLVELLVNTGDVQNEPENSLGITQRVKISGFGGQGVLSAGELLAWCGMSEGLEVTWLPSYGPEMRGGSASVSVILSPHGIGSPLVDNMDVLIAMNGPSLDLFESKVKSKGLILVNSSIVTRPVLRDDVKVIHIPASQLAHKAGLNSAANVVMLTAYLAVSGICRIQTLLDCIPIVFRKKEYLQLNLSLVRYMLEYMKTIDSV